MTASAKDFRSIAVVGAGPAGLVAALAAHKSGFAVKVFEQAADFAKVGGGVMIHSNGQRVLAALGVLKSFRPQMVAVTRGIIKGDRDKVLGEIDFTDIDVPHNRVAVVWRYQLQENLLKAAQAAGIEVNFNHRLDELDSVNEQAILKFENGAFQEVWGDDGRRFGIAPLTENKTYFYARVPLGEWEAIRDKRLEEWIESWGEFGADAIKILRGVTDWQKINYSELYEIRAENWAQPPVFLVGDAAHAMTPNVGQGANSAMVDALILMQMLKRAEKDHQTLAEVGRLYTNLRRPFVTKIQAMARQSGALAANTSTAAHLARNLLFAASRNLGFLRRRSLLITAGYNPLENEYLEASEDEC